MNRRSSYHSSWATADTLDSDDSLTDCEDSDDPGASKVSTSDGEGIVEIQGLELLKHLACEDDDYPTGANEEIDSLVLARRELPRIWLGPPPPTRRSLFEVEPTDSLELARKRLPASSRHRSRRKKNNDCWFLTTEDEPDYTGSSTEHHSNNALQRLPSLETVDIISDDDSDADSMASSSSSSSCGSILEEAKTVDSLVLTRRRFAAAVARKCAPPRKDGTDRLYLGTKTVDSVVLTRKRFADAATSKPVPTRKDGTDRLYLGNKKEKTKEEPCLHEVLRKVRTNGSQKKMPLVRHNSAGARYQGAMLKQPRMLHPTTTSSTGLSPMRRHNSSSGSIRRAAQ